MSRCLICGLALAGPFADCPNCDGLPADDEEWRPPASLDGSADVGSDDLDDLKGEADDELDDELDEADQDGHADVPVDLERPVSVGRAAAPVMEKKRRGFPPGGWPNRKAKGAGETKPAKAETKAAKNDTIQAGQAGHDGLVAALPVIRPARLEESPLFQEMVKEWERLEEDIERCRAKQRYLQELAARAGVGFCDGKQHLEGKL